PAINAAWDDITYASGKSSSNRPSSIKHEAYHPAEIVDLADELGGGYMGSVEVLHQLHCLNMLRQASYEDYYKDKPGPWEDSPQILRHHLDHYIDILRQKLSLAKLLIYDADVGILTYIWVRGYKTPFLDFNIYKTTSSVPFPLQQS
ncbi:oxidase ustYa family protein, partial [Aspergillus homomorphus CBS 101889]